MGWSEAMSKTPNNSQFGQNRLSSFLIWWCRSTVYVHQILLTSPTILIFQSLAVARQTPKANGMKRRHANPGKVQSSTDLARQNGKITSRNPQVGAPHHRSISFTTNIYNHMAGSTEMIVKKNYISDKCLPLHVVPLRGQFYNSSG